MWGAIVGDIVGSCFEFNNIKTKEFSLFTEKSRFTDDTVLTVATIDALLNNKPYAKTYKQWFLKYPDAGYGGSFHRWGYSDSLEPYNSFGNGSAMRVSPVGFSFNTLEEVLVEAKKSAEVTHNHPEGIKGAQATAAAIFLARTGKSKEEIKEYIEKTFHYDLNFTLEEIRPGYAFDETCQGSVPQAIRAFLEAEDFEDAVRNAVSLGGDSDTIACITGSIAEAYFKEIPGPMISEARKRLPQEMIELVEEFYKKVNL